MANTVFVRGGAHSASVEEIWGEKTWRQAEKDSYFNDGRFVGTSPNSLIQVNTDLTKHKGEGVKNYTTGVQPESPIAYKNAKTAYL